jgi:methanogenic corrinoid protein MtbC1
MDRSYDGQYREEETGGTVAGRAGVSAIESLARVALERVAQRDGTAEYSPEFIESLCVMLMAGDYAGAERALVRVTANRPGHARLADGILAAAARNLGRKWDEDAASFAEVSIGVAQIMRLNQAFGQRHKPVTRRIDRRMALFATLPGQAHNLGLVLAAEAFRQQDWQVTLLLDTPGLEVVERARRLRPEAVGLTVSSVDRKHKHANLVNELRALPWPFRILLGGSAARDLSRTLPKRSRVKVVSDITSALRAV